MTLEAITLFGWPVANVGNRLRITPPKWLNSPPFGGLSKPWFRVSSRSSTMPPLLAVAVALSQQIGLLTNDALVVAVMQANGLTNLASHDADFDRVPGLAYAPV